MGQAPRIGAQRMACRTGPERQEPHRDRPSGDGSGTDVPDGGGKNWMGYHVVTHLAMQKLFRERRRPVPGLLMLDQPTQVFYPPEKVADRSVEELGDEDRRAVDRLFELIFAVTKQLCPDLQVIITDHADLVSPWFQQAVVARWRGGEKLVPESWIETAAEPEGPGEIGD